MESTLILTGFFGKQALTVKKSAGRERETFIMMKKSC
jgi:hypothetical protein